MKSFSINNQKQFMKALLSEPVFDEYLVNEITVVKGIRFNLENDAKQETATGYAAVRALVFEFIKGRETPSYMKFVLRLNDGDEGVHKYLNILYKDKSLLVTTGLWQKDFSLDKTIENEWDNKVEAFLADYF